MSRLLGVTAAFVDGRIIPGDVRLVGAEIDAVGIRSAGGTGLAVPGFIDLQVNGFAGVDYAAADIEGYVHADHAMSRTGVTAYQPTLISLPWDRYRPALAVAGEARTRLARRMLGIHLEGPFLAHSRCGAHDPSNLVAPSHERIDALLAGGAVTWATVAPEVDGMLDLIPQLVAGGARVAVGHSSASAATTAMAFAAGATSITHLFNAQSPMHHREPGVPGAALDHSKVTLSIIVDGHHLAPEIVRLVFRVAPDRVALITDAIAATGTGDGVSAIGDRHVTVAGGRAALSDGTLAGSVLTMDAAIRNCVELGIPLEAVLTAATGNPASASGLTNRGTLAPGARADVVVLDDHLEVVRTVAGGDVRFET